MTTNWIVERTLSKGLGWHIQARTDDQFCSFAIVVSAKCDTAHRGKAANGKMDVFTVASDIGHGTMNVLGKIRYAGDWKGIP